MASFIIQTSNDPAYSRILQTVISKSLTHSKTVNGGLIELEIIGSPEDYKFFEQEVKLINEKVGRRVISLMEAI